MDAAQEDLAARSARRSAGGGVRRDARGGPGVQAQARADEVPPHPGGLEAVPVDLSERGRDRDRPRDLQALYYVSHGIEVPAEHAAAGVVTVTCDPSGRPFDWPLVIDGLFRVRSIKSDERPPGAHVAVPYKGDWVYVDETDQATKSTFSLLMELSRLELTGRAG